jgi:hypothetical protein
MAPHHRRAPIDRRAPVDRRASIDRPPAVPSGADGNDAAQQPGAPDAETVVAPSGGDDIEEVEEHDLPVSPSVRAWHPRPATPQELDDARTILVIHRLDPRTGGCAACAADCPCPPALDAGRVLAETGAWNTMPFTNPTGRPTGQASATAEAGWVARLVRRLPWVAGE